MKALTSFAVGAVLLMAGSASAATITDARFSNSDTTIDAQGGSTVSGTFTLQVGQNEVCEVLRTQADPSHPFTDTSVGGPLGYQWGTHTNVPFSVKAPPNTGTFYPSVQCAGTWGGSHSVDGADNVVVGPVNLGTLRVVGSSTGVGASVSSLEQMVKDLQAQLMCVVGGGLWNADTKTCGAKPVVNTTNVCTQLASYEEFDYGDKGNSVKKAQRYIMAHGGEIGPGATGFWGTISADALEEAQDANDCN